jgi:hypothetical protein
VKLALYVCLIFLIFLLGTSSNSSGAATDDTPAVYYYDYRRHAYVMQHVDSNTGYLFADDIVFDDHTDVSGPGWSPSGEWFAWLSGPWPGGAGAYVHYPWLIHRDNSQRTPLLDGFETDTLRLFWHPQRDILVMRAYTSRYGDNVYLIDPKTESFIAAFENVAFDAGIHWSSSGEKFFTIRRTGFFEDRKSTLVVGSIDGTYTERPLQTSSVCDDEDNPPVWWTPDGRLLYMNADSTHLILEAPGSNLPTEMEIPSHNILALNWSPDGRHALIFARVSCDRAGNGQLWLLSMDSSTVNVLSDTGTDFSDIPVNLYPHLYNGWSPDGSSYVFRNGTSIFNVDVDLQTLTSTQLSLSGPYVTTKLTWMNDSQHFLFLWDEMLGLYDIEAEEVDVLVDGVRNYTVSPNEQYIAVQGDCERGEFCIVDLVSKQIVNVVPTHSRGYDWCCQAEFIWHPDSQWLITGLSTGNGNGFSFYFYTDVAGNTHRELGICTNGPHCVGWVPETMNIDDLESQTITLPELPGNEIIIGDSLNYIGKWNADETRFATHDTENIFVFNQDGTMLDAIQVNGYIRELFWNEEQLLVHYSVDTGEQRWQSRFGAWNFEEHELITERPARMISIEPNWIFLRQEDQTEILSAQDYSVVWTLDHGQDTKVWHAHDRVALPTPDGIKIWNISESGLTEFTILERPEGVPIYPGFSDVLDPSGRYAGLTIETAVVIWDLETLEEIFRVAHDGAWTFSPGGNYVALLKWDDEILIYDVLTGELFSRLPFAQFMVWSDDEEILALYDYIDTPLRIWDLPGNQMIYEGNRLPFRWYHNEDLPVPVAISDDYIGVSTLDSCSTPCTVIISRETFEVVKTINRQSYMMQWLGNTLAADNVESLSLTDMSE